MCLHSHFYTEVSLYFLQGSSDLNQSIYREWESLLEKYDFTVASRNTNDDWFKACFQYWFVLEPQTRVEFDHYS